MYQVIKKHPPLVDQYAKKLINDKVVTEDEYKVCSIIYRIAGNIGKNINGFKFGGSVRDHHTYICE